MSLEDSLPPPESEPEAIEVVRFDGDASEWDETLSTLEGGSFCHLGGWREVMSDALGHEPFYWAALDAEGCPKGLLPSVRVRSRLFGDYLVSMPFLSYGGPVGTGPARLALARRAKEQAEALGVDLLELRARTPVPGELKTTTRKVTVLLPLPSDPETLWNDGLKPKVRSQIRRPKKEGMEAHFGGELVDEFYSVFSRTMRDLGTPVLPRAFFEALRDGFPQEVEFCVVRWQGEPVAAGCGFLWDGEFEITWAGFVREHQRNAPNMLLYWGMIERSIACKAHTFNFGRCTAGSGTHRFKGQWGGNDHPLPWAQWSPKGLDATPTPTGRAFTLATSLWQRLPLPVANFIGPFLSRSLP